VFAGGWTLEGAEVVGAGDGVNELDVLDLLDNLVEKSLVLVDGETGHYRLLETIRQYALEKFQEANDTEDVRNRHCAWVLAWAEEIEPKLNSRDQVVRLKQVAVELDNIRVAVEWGLDTDQVEISIRIVIALRSFWDGNSPYRESRGWLEKGISLSEHLPKNIVAKALSQAAWLAYRQNDLEAGVPYAEESLALAEELEDKLLISHALSSIALMKRLMGDLVQAEHYSEKACLLFQEIGDKEGFVSSVADLAITLLYQDKVSSAIQILEGHLHLLDETDDLSTSAWFQFALGGFKVLQSEWEQARVLLKNSLVLYRQINHIHYIGYCLIAMAGVANGCQQAMRAAQLFGAREAIHESIGTNLEPGLQRILTSFVVQTQAVLDESAFASAWAEGRAMTLDEAVTYALDE
jgi:non-specific serine/threonine protein kinase